MTLLAISLFILFAFLPWYRRILPRLFGRENLSHRRIECLAAAVLEGASPDLSLPAILIDALKNRRQKHLDACALADHLARTDPVTGLFKRWYLEYRAVGSGFIVLCDLCDLKTINDRDGLAAGDVLLAQIAKIAAAKVRSADLVARLDGGLLAIWCPDADASGAEVVRTRLCEAIAAQTRVQTRILPSQPSFEGQWWKETEGF